jgi:hypothetical protein
VDSVSPEQSVTGSRWSVAPITSGSCLSSNQALNSSWVETLPNCISPMDSGSAQDRPALDVD